MRASDWIVGLMVAALGLIGLLLAANAYDDEFYLFGLSLAGFAFIFDVGLVKAFYDNKDKHHG